MTQMILYKIVAKSMNDRGNAELTCRYCGKQYTDNINPNITVGTCTLCINGLVDALPKPEKSSRGRKIRFGNQEMERIVDGAVKRIPPKWQGVTITPNGVTCDTPNCSNKKQYGDLCGECHQLKYLDGR